MAITFQHGRWFASEGAVLMQRSDGEDGVLQSTKTVGEFGLGLGLVDKIPGTPGNLMLFGTTFTQGI